MQITTFAFFLFCIFCFFSPSLFLFNEKNVFFKVLAAASSVIFVWWAFEMVLLKVTFRLVRSGRELCFGSFYSPWLHVWIPDLALNLKYKIDSFTGLIWEAAHNISLFSLRVLTQWFGHKRTTLITLPLHRRTAAPLIVAHWDDSYVQWRVLFTMHNLLKASRRFVW